MIPKLEVQEIHDTIPGMRPEPPVTPYDPRRSSRAGALGMPGVAPKKDDPSWKITVALGHFQDLHRRIDDLAAQRDMLARRCAEQARHIAGLLELKAEEAAEAESHPLADSITVMQRQGVR